MVRPSRGCPHPYQLYLLPLVGLPTPSLLAAPQASPASPSAPRGAANAFAACRASWGFRCPHPRPSWGCQCHRLLRLIGLPRFRCPPRLMGLSTALPSAPRHSWGCGRTTTCSNEHRHEPEHERARTLPLEVSTQVPPVVAPPPDKPEELPPAIRRMQPPSPPTSVAHSFDRDRDKP